MLTLLARPFMHFLDVTGRKKEHLGALCTCRVNSFPRPGQTASQEPAVPSCCLRPFWQRAERSPAECCRGTVAWGMRTSEQWLLLCLPSRNLLSGGNNMVLNKELLLFPIKQKLLPINHLIPQLCSSISLSLLLSLHLLLTVLATHVSFNAVSLQNGFLIK